MIIAIHKNPNSFSERWVSYCVENGIKYKLVDCYRTNICEQVRDCDIIMWHHHHESTKDKIFAKQLLFAFEHSGKKVFPDFKTGWHFDDKIGQKYLFESLGLPCVKSYIFYNQKEAEDWIQDIQFPIVFKLRNGASSQNVRLVKSLSQGKRLIKRAFKRGFNQEREYLRFSDNYNKFINNDINLKLFLKSFLYYLIFMLKSPQKIREKGYVYFQDYISGNISDTRVIVIGNKAFSIKRINRSNDFRASGSGKIVFDSQDVDCIKIAFEANKKIDASCIAFDFLYDQGVPNIIEISFGFSVVPYDNCPGYWDRDFNWHAGNFNPQSWIIDNLIANL